MEFAGICGHEVLEYEGLEIAGILVKRPIFCNTDQKEKQFSGLSERKGFLIHISETRVGPLDIGVCCNIQKWKRSSCNFRK
jgi:hypothetical protein